jgi:hypothetical protein
MQGEGGERWQLLCKLAEQEQDPEKLLELAAAIERLLSEKQQRLEQQPRGNGTAA